MTFVEIVIISVVSVFGLLFLIAIIAFMHYRVKKNEGRSREKPEGMEFRQTPSPAHNKQQLNSITTSGDIRQDSRMSVKIKYPATEIREVESETETQAKPGRIEVVKIQHHVNDAKREYYNN